MSSVILYFFQNAPGESEMCPNAFVVPDNTDITFETFLSYFPDKSQNLHFRFKTTDKSYDHVWTDVTNRNQRLPLYNGHVFAKVLKLDDASLLKQRCLLRKKAVDVSASSSFVQASPQADDTLRRRQETTTNQLVSAPAPSSSTPRSTASPKPTVNVQPQEAPADFLRFDPIDSNSTKSSNSTNNASVDIDIGEPETASSPKLTRDELAARREENTQERVRDALEFKRELDDKAAKESQEVDAAKDKHDKALLAWATNNKERRNIRTLLSTMHTVLWADSKWKAIGLGDVIEPRQIKLQYRKAMLVVHPDRCSHLDGETRFIAKRVFEAINEAYDEFLKKEGL